MYYHTEVSIISEVCIILGHDGQELRKSIDSKIGTANETVAVLAELGLLVNVPMKGKIGQNFCHFASTEDPKMGEKFQSW